MKPTFSQFGGSLSTNIGRSVRRNGLLRSRYSEPSAFNACGSSRASSVKELPDAPGACPRRVHNCSTSNNSDVPSIIG